MIDGLIFRLCSAFWSDGRRKRKTETEMDVWEIKGRMESESEKRGMMVKRRDLCSDFGQYLRHDTIEVNIVSKRPTNFGTFYD